MHIQTLMEDLKGFPVSKINSETNFVLQFFMKIPNFTFWKHLRTTAPLKECACSIEIVQHQIKTNHSCKWHSFVCWQFKLHLLNLLHWKFKIKCHIIQFNTVTLMQTMHMLKCKFTHAQLEAWTYSSVSMRLLTWKLAYA